MSKCNSAPAPPTANETPYEQYDLFKSSRNDSRVVNFIDPLQQNIPQLSRIQTQDMRKKDLVVKIDVGKLRKNSSKGSTVFRSAEGEPVS